MEQAGKAISTLAAISALLLLMLAVSCAGGDGEPTVERFEEAGVEVVLSSRPAWGDGEGWRLTAEPQLVIGEGTEDPRYLFSTIRGGRLGPASLGPVRLPEGHIVAGDLRSLEIRFFDPSGRFVRAATGQGEGPSEMTNLTELAQCVPGLVSARNSYQDEVVVFDGAGEVRTRIRLDDNAGRALYVPLSCNGKGQFLALDRGDELAIPGQSELGLYRPTVHIWLLDPEGFVLRDLGAFPGGERLGTPRGSGPHPLGKTTTHALGECRAYIGTADTFEVEVWSLEGVLQQRWRRRTNDLTVSAADVEKYTAPGSPHTFIAEELEDMSRRFTPLPLPATYPAYTRFVVDATGHLWVENFPVPNEARHLWSVFDPAGVWLGEVEVPPTFDITEVGEDYVLSVYRDELDEPSIRMYGLSR